MAKTRIARIASSKHKTQPFTVSFDKRVDTKVKQRYASLYHAAVGAGRQEADFLKLGGTLKIIYPDGRWRTAKWEGGALTLGELKMPKEPQAKK